MASFSVLEDFHIHPNEAFLQTADALMPELHRKTVAAPGTPSSALQKGDDVQLDFGDHYVGYLTLKLGYQGCHPDAPAYIRLRFGEGLAELAEEPLSYDGWLGRGWFQEEFLHIDVLPVTVRLPRRYAFRYLKMEVLGTSEKYRLILQEATVDAVSAVTYSDVKRLQTGDPLLDRIDQVSLRTLANCMQCVFEDGPKRDRRMWLGDLYLQAKVNHVTYRQENLVKRCLYLFAGLPFNEGRLAACLFTEPVPEPDDTYLFDYALLFGATLWEYYEQTRDGDTLKELYPVALRQTEIARTFLTEEHILPDHSGEFWCFTDWGDGLNTQAASLAELIFGIGYQIKLARTLCDEETVLDLSKLCTELKTAAKIHFWDEAQGFFVSGKERQISWATQVWMILAEVITGEEARELLRRTVSKKPKPGMVSPYMRHYFVEALLKIREWELALQEIKEYWGGMIRCGADTFWEIFDPEDPDASPYGCKALNSCCHAWSCTPAWFLRKYEVVWKTEENEEETI